MLFILIPTAWMAVAFLALAICRLAALSDDSGAVALAEWMATSYFAEHKDVPAESPSEQLAGADRRLQPLWRRAARTQAISRAHIK